MDQTVDIESDLCQLANAALAGRRQDVLALLRRLHRSYASERPALAERLLAIVRDCPTVSSPIRSAEPPIPVDIDSRLPLLRIEPHPSLDVEPVYSGDVTAALAGLAREPALHDDLLRAGVPPTRTVIFTGPPGVGKTLAARWLADRRGTPLLTLDLSAVMSSFLGRTGSNLRHVLDYAKSRECVLLLDEFDAIAKRRDDASEVGELKRLVTVLLQEVDDWPVGSLLVAATNHASLLDPAAWRRFDARVDFDLPAPRELRLLLERLVVNADVGGGSAYVALLCDLLSGLSHSDVTRQLARARRSAVLKGLSTASCDVLKPMVCELSKDLDRGKRLSVAIRLVEGMGISQRTAADTVGVSRETLRGRLKASRGGDTDGGPKVSDRAR